MAPGDLSLPESLMPGNGAVRPTVRTSGYGGSPQSQTPTSPADRNVPFDSPHSRSSARNGPVNNGMDGIQNPDGRSSRMLDTNPPSATDPSSPLDRSDYWERSTPRDRSRPTGRSNTKSPGSQRLCKKCDEPLTGQFVRALNATYHLECFKCEVITSASLPSWR